MAIVLSAPIALFAANCSPQLLAAEDNPLIQNQALAPAEKIMAKVILEACDPPNKPPGRKFRKRCIALVDAARREPGSPKVRLALLKIFPKQLASFGIGATRTMAGQTTIATTSVLGRLQTLRASLGSTQFAGIQFFHNGQPIAGGNAGSDAFGNLGVWIKGSFHLGEVDSTPTMGGFNYKNWGVTGGADYRISNALVAGGAFTYITSDNDFDHNGGHADNDAYLGSIYGTFYPLEDFYIDALATYGHINFDISRNINYVILGDTVNTRARGDTDGNQWGFTVSSGYNLHWQALSFAPYGRFSYLRFKVDDYHETGGNGWGMRFEEQHIRSMKGVVGGRISYTISLPWGVVTPQVRGEWHHEFRDPSRTITASFLGDPLAQPFAIRVPPPDRDYASFGTDLTATFAYGISAFVGYEALVGYRHISSHRITFGTRIQF